MCAGEVKVLGKCGTAVQLSVHTVYRYGGYCSVCHGENREIGGLLILVIAYLIAELFIKWCIIFNLMHFKQN